VGAADGGEGAQRVEAHVGVDGQRVGAEAGDRRVAESGRGAEEALGVGGGGDVDVAALAVGEDEEAGGAPVVDRRGEGGPAGGAEALEAGDLRLDRDDGVADGVDDGAAVGEDGGGGVGGGRRLGPEVAWVGVEAEDDLGFAVGDDGRQAVGDVLGGRLVGQG
jgi:hypothetical protein